MALKEEQRLKRIHAAAEESHAKARMPRRMEQALENAKRNPKKVQMEEFSFRPMINEPKTAANFKKMQDKFQEQLMKTKSEKRVTVPKSPNFRPTKSKPLERSYVNEGRPPTGAAGKTVGASQSVISQAAGGDKLKATLAAKSTKSKASTEGPVKQPSSTRATALLQQRRREEIEAKKAEEERKAKEEADRIARQN